MPCPYGCTSRKRELLYPHQLVLMKGVDFHYLVQFWLRVEYYLSCFLCVREHEPDRDHLYEYRREYTLVKHLLN